MFKDKRRIILAKIEIPIEFFPDGSHINHNDRACVNFYRCPLLPPQQNYDDVDFGEIIENLLSEGFPSELDDDENPMFIMKQPEIEVDIHERHHDHNPETQPLREEEQEEEQYDQEQEQQEQQEQEQEQENETTEEYYILKSEIPSNPRPPSKNTSFKRNPSRGKRSVTYKMRGSRFSYSG
jgi:hypothetical protein